MCVCVCVCRSAEEVQFDPDKVLGSLETMLGVNGEGDGDSVGSGSGDGEEEEEEEEMRELMDQMDQELAALGLKSSVSVSAFSNYMYLTSLFSFTFPPLSRKKKMMFPVCDT